MGTVNVCTGEIPSGDPSKCKDLQNLSFIVIIASGN